MTGAPAGDSVTVLYTDLAGFTARSHAADPEDARAIQRPYHARARRAVELRGGSVEKFIGDAVVASFDDARSALEAGEAVIAAVRALGDEALAVRVGVASGSRAEGEVPGTLVEVAARLQALSSPDGICVDDPTRRALGLRGGEALPAMVLPGRARPAPVHRFAPSVAVAVPAATTRLVDDEVAEERKVITVLFCDLFHIAAPSVSADPRDLRATERLSYAPLKREIETYGGTVEKFLGDTLMAVFGAPVTREDDAERAVSAALRICDVVADLNADDNVELGVRVAVNTGEVVVALGARPEEGEGLVTGDAVNVGARLLGAAPFSRVVVGPATYDQTRGAFAYEQLAPVLVKGIPDPVTPFVALKPKRAAVRAAAEGPFVGRGRELALLQDAYLRIARGRKPEFVAVSGEAGQGKSRLLAEFRRFVDGQVDVALWREGRCRPYGDATGFAPLADLVGHHAHILETDTGADAGAKLREAVRALTRDPSERDWLTARLAPLVGSDVPGAEARVERTEAFAAWRRFLDLVAQQKTLVVAIEDLHWAEEAMLDFLEDLTDAQMDAPLLVVATTRPDLYDSRPEWSAGRAGITHAALPPLTDEEQADLVASLFPEGTLVQDTRTLLLERSGGNPLYTVELVRLLRDRSLVQPDPDGVSLAAGAELALPTSVHAVIAARLDALAPARKALVQDASVVGKTFWAGALAALGAGGGQDALAELVERELVRPVPVPSVEGDEEYVFSHALVRDVAYGQLPRAVRVKKHRSAAVWIEGIAGDRLADHADALVYHYGAALELARAARLPDARGLESPTRRFLVLAGDRATRIDLPKAEDYYARALGLATGADRPPILLALARTETVTGREQEAAGHLAEAMAEFERAGDDVGKAEALLRRVELGTQPLAGMGAKAVRREAVALLEPYGPTQALALGYRSLGDANLYSEPGSSVELADKAIAVCRQLGLDDELATAYSLRGRARFYLGDNTGGLGDLRRALDLCVERGLGYETVNAYSWLSVHTWLQDGPAKGLALDDEAVDVARKRGVMPETITVGARPRILFDLGAWDDLLSETALRSRGIAHWQVAAAHALVHRGAAEEAEELVTTALATYRSASGVARAGLLAPALVVAALVAAARGDRERAVGLVNDAYGETDVAWFWRAWLAHDASRILGAAGELGLAERFVANTDPCDNRRRFCVLTGQAVLAEARGELRDAARRYGDVAGRWADWGHPLEHGLARLGAGRCRFALGEGERAGHQLREARSVFTRLGAESLVAEIDSLLSAAASTPSSP